MRVAQIPENWTEEGLEGTRFGISFSNLDLNLRVLYRLKFLNETIPLDITSFQYCLPLALEILNVGSPTDKERAEAEEKITLSLLFISFHASLCIFISL